ncbi:unnamed protein product [Cuscuta epithymum]|uniref:Uncharacterized protein n=1 Tax=Cuscuta epithymum TaxID=186058 RepID=A0AAV0C369_9ASTE|nr:unnamed protein product [Cuscuta epithymum]
MGRAPCCSKQGLKKGPWSSKEDSLLTLYIQQHGESQWRSLPKKAGLLRCGKSCRLRWMNYLRPGIKRGNFTGDEEDLIVRLHSLLGNRWSLIAGRLPGRTDNEIKNYWNTHLFKKLKSSGIEPRQRPAGKNSSRKKHAANKEDKNKTKNKKEKIALEKDIGMKEPCMDKVLYAPKPIRPSSVSSLSRNGSLEDVAGSVSSSSSGQGENRAFIPWHLFEPRPDDFCDDILNAFGDVSPPQCPTPGCDDGLLDKVYEEYLQLLSENCFLEDGNCDWSSENVEV